MDRKFNSQIEELNIIWKNIIKFSHHKYLEKIPDNLKKFNLNELNIIEMLNKMM